MYTAVSADEDLSISNTFEIQPKSGTSSSLKSNGIQSESQSLGTEALVVEVENEELDICITGTYVNTIYDKTFKGKTFKV